jgi:hypothetical protein
MRVQGGGSNELEKPYGAIAKDKLNLGPLDKDAKLRRANLRWHQHGTFWREIQLVHTQKMEFKGKLMVWKIKM